MIALIPAILIFEYAFPTRESVLPLAFLYGCYFTLRVFILLLRKQFRDKGLLIEW